MQEVELIKGIRGINDAWDYLVTNVIDKGAEVSPRGKKTKELEDVTIKYDRPSQYVFYNPIRQINPTFHLVELFYFLNGRDDNLLSKYLAKMDEYKNPLTERFDGSYGPPLYYGLPRVVTFLKGDKDTRRAVIPILDQRHLAMTVTNDFPCNIDLAFRIRNDKLNMNVVTRSQDLYRGFIYDTLEFQLLQFMVATALGLKVGSYCHHLFSLHLYEKDISEAKRAVGKTEVDNGGPVMYGEWGLNEFYEYIRLANAAIDNPEEIAIADDALMAIRARALYQSTKKKETPPLMGIYTRWVTKWLNSRK